MVADAMPTVLWIDDPAADPAALGGKVASLAEMTAAGFGVPPAFGVTTAAFARFAESAALRDAVDGVRAGLDVDDHEAVAAASRAIGAIVEAAPVPADVADAIGAAYARLCARAGEEGVPVAVRSSAVNEDLEGASFAGQYETYLWIRGADEVVANVRRCWASLFNPAALTYRPSAGAEAVDPLAGMCVGVQQMVPARSAGVMFTIDPVSGDRSRMVIESCWGLGEGVVKGDVTPDRHRVDKVSLEIVDSEVGAQTHEYRFDEAARAVGLLTLPGDRVEAPSLSPDEVRAIAELGKRIERHRGGPQDVEWAVAEDGTLHLLQARPETVWAGRRSAAAAGDAGGSASARVISTFMGFGGGSGK
ncbi:MAG: PEP/pyruvate-binding domain-containing protein [Thermoleophilia bacterium]